MPTASRLISRSGFPMRWRSSPRRNSGEPGSETIQRGTTPPAAPTGAETPMAGARPRASSRSASMSSFD
eukprot:974465-Pyramimonas_sp.AAC.1